MARTRARIGWSHSFYWRVAVVFVACLIGVVAAEAVTLLWLVNLSDVGGGPALRQTLDEVAADLSTALSSDPALDLSAYVNHRYPHPERPFIVLMHDGRVEAAGASAPSFVLDARRRRLDRTSAPVPMPPRRPAPVLRPQPMFTEIIQQGRPVGVVMPSPQDRIARLSVAAAGAGLALVLAGTAVAALVVFRPLRRRMGQLEETAMRVGQGQTEARAPEQGKDEWAALARAFNRMAEDLRARDEKVRTTERMRRVLLADVSHELRTPLTTMRGYLETLLSADGTVEASTARRYVEILCEETRRLERIVGDLLELARLEVAGDTLDRQDVPVENLFGRTVARAELEAQAGEIQLSTWIAAEAEIVTGDPLRLEQALQNLVSNAMRHTRAGGRIELAAVAVRDGIRISVCDTGAGIAAEHLPFVFDRFYKVDASRPHDSTGSGLGLSIVKAIVERHGGHVSVESRVGAGTTFTMHLPDMGAAATTT